MKLVEYVHASGLVEFAVVENRGVETKIVIVQ